MSEYTKGPWSLETVPTTAGSCHKIGPFPSMGVRPHVHACVYADGIRIGLDEKSPVAVELLANARLIAAAPELLEALESVLDSLGALTKQHELLGHMDEGEANKVWAALHKATGRPMP